MQPLRLLRGFGQPRLLPATDKEANALILSGPAHELDQIDRIVTELSYSTISGEAEFRVFTLKDADPVIVACQLVQAFQTIVSRNKRPVEAAVISVTMIHTGEATNVVPESCEIQGTVRTFTLEVLDLIETRMRQIAEGTAAAFGAGAPRGHAGVSGVRLGYHITEDFFVSAAYARTKGSDEAFRQILPGGLFGFGTVPLDMPQGIGRTIQRQIQLACFFVDGHAARRKRGKFRAFHQNFGADAQAAVGAHLQHPF